MLSYFRSGGIYLVALAFWCTGVFGDTTEFAVIRLPDIVAMPGESLSIPVMVSALSGDGVISADLAIEYDAEVLSATGIAKAGTQTASWDSAYNIISDGSLGTLHVGLATATDLAPGNGELLFLKFDVSPSASWGSVSPLHFAEAMLDEVEGQAEDGSVAVGARVGDVSMNGSVTAFDASIILRFRVGFTDENEYPGLRAAVADVDRSGQVTALDASYILRHVVGIVPSLPVSPEFLVKPVVAMRNVWLGAPERSAEGVRVPIHVDEMAGILSGEMVLSFDGEEIEAGASELTSEYLFASRVSEGKVRVAFAGAESVEGSGVLAYLRIGVPSDAFDLGALRLDRVVLNDGGIVVQLTERLDTPGEYHLAQNRPNPFNPSTTIQFRLPASGRVLLSVYNARGQLLRTLVSGFRDAGVYTAMWDGRDDHGQDVASGVYLCRMEAGEYRAVRKLALVR